MNDEFGGIILGIQNLATKGGRVLMTFFVHLPSVFLEVVETMLGERRLAVRTEFRGTSFIENEIQIPVENNLMGILLD